MHIHPDASTPLKRAMADLATLVEENAPRPVLAAATATVDAVRQGVPPSPAWGIVLMDHAGRRSRQNRYGQ